MPDWKEFLDHYDPSGDVSVDFERAVFLKIGKRKRRKKMTYAVMAVAAIGIAIAAFQLLSSRFQPNRRMMVESISPAKEEIPLKENLYFASSDRNTQYSIERISYPINAESNQGI